MYDEIVCDLLPINIILAEYFIKETKGVDKSEDLRGVENIRIAYKKILRETSIRRL